MKKPFFVSLAVLALLASAHAQKQGPPPVITTDATNVPPAPPMVYQASPTVVTMTPPPPSPVYVYDQQSYGQTPVLVSPDQAQSVVDQFRSNYAKLGSPRILIYVNRELVDQQSGLKLSARSETVDTTRSTSSSTSSGTNSNDKKDSVTSRSVAKNTYRDNGQTTPTLADRQTVRDVERLMGRPLRAAGASLVDQRVAAQLIGDRPLESLTLENEQARKDREAVNQIADVVLEVLMSSRTVTVQEVTGPRTYSVPDIQVTAIRLKDAKLIGQASASDVMNKAGGPATVARNFGVQDVTEATALALMQDMLQEAK